MGNLNSGPGREQHSTATEHGNLEKGCRAQAMSEAAREHAAPQARMVSTKAVKKPHFCLTRCLDTAWWKFAIEALIIINSYF